MSGRRVETKVVRIDSVNTRKQQKVLDREARDGWRLVQVVKGPVLRSWANAHLERDVSAAAPAKKRSWFSAPESTDHAHAWRDTTTKDDRRNGVRVSECACGKAKTEEV